MKFVFMGTSKFFCPFCTVHARSLCLISSKRLKYNKIQYFRSSAPAISKPEKGTKISQFLSPEIRKGIIPMLFFAFTTHLQGVKVICRNNRFLEFHGQINHFIGVSGVEKDLLNEIIETICHFLRAGMSNT